ncbi:hypothetical protein FSP39_009390 [Pinctada imbricata]|uniref:G-protein coupled receptors family 1 profile domain-containing protein n=1 Tax=Pinctada imbricata TaxID=66713 RepID=A0AA89BLZ6_PINIB|nr:hypothetical protein FSP39_009390 [Pinctada imbricata]
MSHALRRFMLAFSVIFSLSASAPILHFYGGLPIENRTLNVTGLTCALLHTIDMKKFYNYQYVSVVINTLGLAALTAAYAAIGVKVIHKRRSIRIYNIQHREETMNDDTDKRTSRFQNGGEGNNSGKAGANWQGTKRKKMAKLSKMFRTISIIAFLSYVPIRVFIFIESSNFSFWDELSVVLLQVCLILRTSYLLIHTTNPFIYAYLDCQFRQELISLFRIRGKPKDNNSNELSNS